MGYVIIGFFILLILVYVSIKIYLKLYEYDGSDYLLFACLFIVLWAVTYFFYLYEIIIQKAVYWYLFRFVCRGIVYTSLWIFSLKCTNRFLKVKKNILITFYLMPCITTILALTNNYHDLVFNFVTIVRTNPGKYLIYTYGIWYYIDLIYCLASIIFSITLFSKNYTKILIIFKGQYLMYIIGFSSILFFEIISAVNIFRDFDVSLIGSTLGIFLIHWALISYKGNDLMVFAKDAVFEKISSVCLVVQNDGRIMDSNPEAKKIFEFVGKKLEDLTYNDLLKSWDEQKEAVFFRNEEGFMINIRDRGRVLFFQVSESEIKDKNGNKAGNFIEMRDVTMQQKLIAELSRLANHDQLTNLYNRRYFDKMCEKYNSPLYFPLGFVSGDLNKLKTTNDTHGHLAGDRLIVLISGILKSVAPKDAVVARHGGDEFLILLPGKSEVEVKKYISRVNALCEEVYEEPFGHPSISLGYSVKTKMEQNIQELLINADLLMYRNKQARNKSEEPLELQEKRFKYYK